MTNRLQYLLGPPPEANFNDLYEIDTLGRAFVVSFATAVAVLRALDQFATPDWLEFHDVFGERQRVLALCVYRIRYLSGGPFGTRFGADSTPRGLAGPNLAAHL